MNDKPPLYIGPQPPLNTDTAQQEPPAPANDEKPDPLIDGAHAYLTMCCVGFIASHQGVPNPALWSALVQAFGRVISTVSMSDNLSATLAVRAKAKEQFSAAVNKFAKPMQPGVSLIRTNGRA
jgi:hypothetical protein